MSERNGDLLRGLSYLGATSVVVGNVIGTGIFLKARVMTCNVGTPEMVMIVWVAAGLLSLAGALSYAELAAMMPRAGGEYVFMREAYGRRWAFLYGWTQFAISLTGSQAAKGVIIAIMINVLTEGLLDKNFVTLSFFGFSIPLGMLQITAVAAIWVVTLINCARVSASSKILSLITGLKALIVLAIGFAAFAFGKGDWSHFGLTNVGGTCEGVSPAAIGGVAGFAAAMLGALWAYDGWNALPIVAGEVRNPRRNIPLALITGMCAVIFLYLFANTSYFYVLTPTEIASVSQKSAVATEVVTRFLGAIAAGLMAACLLTSSVGTLYTGILAAARVPYAMSQDRIFFEKMGTVSGAHVPAYALIIQAVWISILTLSGSFDTLTDYAMFASWIFYGMVTASLFLFRRKVPASEQSYRTWGYPVVPILFLLVTLWLLINTIVTAPLRSFIGLTLIALGLPIYWYFNRRK